MQPRRFAQDELLIGLGIGALVAVALYAAFSLVLLLTDDASIRCTAKQAGSPDISVLVYGEYRWQWLPPTPVCRWRVAADGTKLGPPIEGEAVVEEPDFAPAVSWAVAVAGLAALPAIALGCRLRWKTRSDSRD